MKDKKCIVCSKPFHIRTSEGKSGRLKEGIRQRNCVTCSRECSRKYRVIYNRIVNSGTTREVISMELSFAVSPRSNKNLEAKE